MHLDCGAIWWQPEEISHISTPFLVKGMKQHVLLWRVISQKAKFPFLRLRPCQMFGTVSPFYSSLAVSKYAWVVLTQLGWNQELSRFPNAAMWPVWLVNISVFFLGHFHWKTFAFNLLSLAFVQSNSRLVSAAIWPQCPTVMVLSYSSVLR